jgi:hypothetical protein
MVRQNIDEALKLWDGSDLQSIGISAALLSSAADELRKFQVAFAAGAPSAAGVRLDLLQIKPSINRFLSVVDAASALIAGLRAVSADTGIFYDAAGVANTREEQAVCRAC